MREVQGKYPRFKQTLSLRAALCSFLNIAGAVTVVLSGQGGVRAQAASQPQIVVSAQISTTDIMTSGGIPVSSYHLRPGQTLYVTLNLLNAGSGTARFQGPPPRTVYTQGQTYTQKGLKTIQSDRYSVVMTLSGPRGREWPYRWSLGSDLKLGQTRRVRFPLRLTQPGLYTLYVGIAAGKQVRELSLGQIGLEVARHGQAFQTRPGGPVGTPPPTRITINGKAVAMDQWPLFYQASLGEMTENPEIMVPIRFVTEEMGAAVQWQPGTRTADIRRGNNHLELHAGSQSHLVNGKTVASHTPLRIVGGRTMVPINFLIEQLGGSAKWDIRTRTLAITLPNLAASSTQ